jgi:hypothetical protein
MSIFATPCVLRRCPVPAGCSLPLHTGGATDHVHDDQPHRPHKNARHGAWDQRCRRTGNRSNKPGAAVRGWPPSS